MSATYSAGSSSSSGSSGSSSIASSSSYTSYSSSSSSSSSKHPASLVDASAHSPALLSMLAFPVTKPSIEYLVDKVSETVDFAMGRRSPSRKRSELTKFTQFVSTVLTRAEVTTPVLVSSLVYIERAKPHLHIALEEWALERVFLGALIVASKYLNDSTLKNVHWALCTGVFGKRDVGRIEREFLDVLDFELGIRENDLLAHSEALLALQAPRPAPKPPVAVSAPMPLKAKLAPKPSPISNSPVRNHRRSYHQSATYHRPEPTIVQLPAPYSPSSDSSSSGSDSDGWVSPRTPSPPTTSAQLQLAKRSRPLPKQTSRGSSYKGIIASFPALPRGRATTKLQLSSHDFPMPIRLDGDGDVDMH